MIYLVFLMSFTLLAACDTVKQLTGQVVVSVENATEIDGFEVYAHGKKRFSLDAGEKKSFSVTDVTQFSRKSSISPQYLGSIGFDKPQDRELLRNISQ